MYVIPLAGEEGLNPLIPECTGYDDLPAEDDPRMPKPDWWFVALLGVAAFSAVAACFVIAGAAPLI